VTQWGGKDLPKFFEKVLYKRYIIVYNRIKAKGKNNPNGDQNGKASTEAHHPEA
jgi:hypothetical protein